MTLTDRRSLSQPLRHIANVGGTLGLVACVCLMLLAMAGRDLWRVYQNNIEQAHISTTTATRLIAEQVDVTLQTADSIVVSLVERVETEGLGLEARNRLYRLMTSLAAALPAIHEMGITDRDGNAIVKSLVPNPVGLNYRERGYFKYHAGNPDRGPFIGARIQSKIDGSYNVTVTRRFNDAEGGFAGVIVTSVSMQAFQHLFDQMQARSGGVIALLSEDGTILARSPSLPDGGAASTGDDVRRLLERRSGPATFSDVSGIDGMRRLGSYEHLHRFPMTVVVSQSEWDVQRSWRQEVFSHLCILFGVSVVLVVLGGREVRARKLLKAMAMQDGLTGLANRRQFDERLNWELRRAARTERPVSLIILDLDRFKAYNDHFGHLGGDECLRTAAQTVRKIARRSGDLAARFGGEEFAILLPDATSEQAFAAAEELRAMIQDLDIAHSPAVGGAVTISAGVATVTPTMAISTIEAKLLVARADAALYKGKSQGRNVVVIAEGSLATDA